MRTPDECLDPLWMAGRDGQIGRRGAAWSSRALSVLGARHASPGLSISAIGFHALVRSDDGHVDRGTAAVFADLARPGFPPVPAAHQDPRPGRSRDEHVVDVVADRSGSYAIWADGVRVGRALPPGLVLPTVSWLFNQGAIAHAGGLVLFHAAALCSGDVGLLLPATSGSGKSTLSVALVAAGLSYLSDEVGALDAPSRRLLAYPKPISLDDTSFVALAGAPVPVHRERVLDEAAAHWTALQWQVPASAIRPGAVAASCSASVAVFPVRAAGARSELRPLGRATLCARLVQHSMSVARRPAEHFAACAELASRIGGFELVYGDLAEACALLLSLLDGATPPGTLGGVGTR